MRLRGGDSIDGEVLSSVGHTVLQLSASMAKPC